MKLTLSLQTLKKLEGVKFVSKVVTVVHKNPSAVADIDANASLSMFGKNVIFKHSSRAHLPFLPRQFDLLEFLSYEGKCVCVSVVYCLLFLFVKVCSEDQVLPKLLVRSGMAAVK